MYVFLYILHTYMYMYTYIYIYIYININNNGDKYSNCKLFDTTFNLMNNTYKPYGKPHDEPLYIYNHSNNPPSVLTSFQNQ